jgi:hypothetical protein
MATRSASTEMRLKVECHAGYKADERPVRFTSEVPGARTFEVKEVLDQWYGPEYQCFRVRADDGNLYILRHSARNDVWTLDSFRRD